MSALAAPRAMRRRIALPDVPLVVRGLAVLALVLAGGTWWTRMLAPAPTHRALAWTALGGALAACLVLAGRLPGPARQAGAALAAVAGLAASLPAVGVPLRLLAPAHWDELGAGIGRGLAALPGLLVPYDGAPGGWTARTVLAGGAGLVVLAVALALWPRGSRRGFPALAAVPLMVLAGVPAVVVHGQDPVGQGLVLFVGLAALLAADRVVSPDVPVALVALLLAAVAAVALRPALDAERPWFDYEAAAGRLGAVPVTFDWSQGYGPLDWPRTGREVLRIASPRPLYWKAQDLEGFDGVGWTPLPPGSVSSDAGGRNPFDLALEHPEWVRRIRVAVGGVRSDRVFTPGEPLDITGAPHPVATESRSGAFPIAEPLRDGDGYAVTSYVPRPGPRALATAGDVFPGALIVDRVVRLPPAGLADLGPRGAASRALVRAGTLPELVVPAWGSGAGLRMFDGASPSDAIRGSAYAGVWDLARRLRGGTATPYAYARRILAYLSSRPFRYTESPPPAGAPLADFLLRTHQGYCQHFAGAMALLLRMGGVPARVSTGFAPGQRDAQSGEWVVRDTDAHSWVEAYFPGLGWVTLDPTPAASPARGQETSNLVPKLVERVGSGPAGAATPLDPRGGGLHPLRGTTSAPMRGAGGPSAWLWALLGAGVLTAAGAAFLLVRRARRRPGSPAERAFAELEQALRRSGRPAAAPVTLRTLEERLRAAPEAAAYVRAVRALRFGRPGSGPSAAQRRALRTELARGLGVVGRVRAWWALPPRRREGPGTV